MDSVRSRMKSATQACRFTARRPRCRGSSGRIRDRRPHRAPSFLSRCRSLRKPYPDVSRRRRREHRVGRQLAHQPVGIRPPRLLGRACDDQRAFPRARQSRRRHVHIPVEDKGRCRGGETAATTALVRGFHLADGADGRRPAVRPAHRAVESRNDRARDHR